MKISISHEIRRIASFAQFLENVKQTWEALQRNPKKFVDKLEEEKKKTRENFITRAVKRGLLTLREITEAISEGTDKKVKVNIDPATGDPALAY